MKQLRPRWSGPLNCPIEQGFFGLSKVEARLGRITLRVLRDGRRFTVDVASDGEGLVSHAGAGLLAEAADRLGLTAALSEGLARTRERRGGHDRGRAPRGLAGVVAHGGARPAHPRPPRAPET